MDTFSTNDGLGMSVYQGNIDRTTLDGEWTEEELAGDVDDECMKLIPQLISRYKNRAMYDTNLLKPPYLAEKIKSENDLIEIYNKCADAHRSEKVFGIHWFDQWVAEQIKSILNNNLVGGGK